MTVNSLIVEKEMDFSTSIFDKDVCIFVSFAPYGKIRPGALSYYQEILNNGINVVVCLIANDPSILKYDNRLDDAMSIIYRTNNGWDFSAWADVLRYMPQLWSAKRLYFANDSVICLPTLFSQVIHKVRLSSADYIAMTDSFESFYHTQSYFFVLQNNALLSKDIYYFWRDLTPLLKKKDVTYAYEMTFLDLIKKSNLSTEIMFPIGRFFSVRNVVDLSSLNPTLNLWETLINNGFPFIKVSLIADNPRRQPVSHWKYIARKYGADILANDIHVKMVHSYNNLKYQEKNIGLLTYKKYLKNKKGYDSRPILVHAHVFYHDIWPEIESSIRSIEGHDYELIVTIVDGFDRIYSMVKKFNKDAKIFSVKNKGYDVGAFMYVLKKIDITNYSYIVKLHTKRNMPEKSMLLKKFAVEGSLWRRYSLAFLDTPETFRSCLAAFRDNPMLGMCARYNLIVADKRRDKSTDDYGGNILNQMGLLEKKRVFVAGTMFMVRAKLFEPLLLLEIDIDDFATPVRGEKESLAHTFERVFGWMIGAQGYAVQDCFTPVGLRIRERSIQLLGQIRRFFYHSRPPKKGKRVVKICGITIYLKDKVLD